jgi:hypothetical protein
VFKVEYYENYGQAVCRVIWYINNTTDEYIFPLWGTNIKAYKTSAKLASDRIYEKTWNNTGSNYDGLITLEWPNNGKYAYAYDITRPDGTVTAKTSINTNSINDLNLKTSGNAKISDGKYIFTLYMTTQ